MDSANLCYPLRPLCVLAVVLTLACSTGAVVAQEWTTHPTFTLPESGFRFGNIYYMTEPNFSGSLGQLTETSDGFAFPDLTLAPIYVVADSEAHADILFRLRNPNGIRSITYEFSGGYSFGDIGSRRVSTGATITLGASVPDFTASAGGSKLFEINAVQSNPGTWSAIAQLDVADSFGAGARITDAWVTIAHVAEASAPVETFARLWTDSVRLRVVALPEPTTASILGVGILGLTCARRKHGSIGLDTSDLAVRFRDGPRTISPPKETFARRTTESLSTMTPQ